MDKPQAFDPLASTYDADFTHTQIASYLRGRVHSRLDQHFHPGDHVLELGCGTGEDALYLAGRGIHVLATDASEGMLAAARQKTAGNPLVQVEHLDLQTVGTPFWASTPLPNVNMFNGAFSNFGPLNCLFDWKPLAQWLAEHIKPGGVAAFGVMSPFCLWEIGWHGLHGNFKTAFRRLRKKSTFQADSNAQAIPIHYPTIQRLTQDFAPWFRQTHIEGLGVFLPPSDAYGVIEKRPRLLQTLMKLEQCLGYSPKLALFADHYWIEFERSASH
jgi:SAM-dependent methyltransferase